MRSEGRTRFPFGLCSPDIAEHNGTFYLTYSSWGDKSGAPNQLFYAVSNDLEHWDAGHPLGADITTGVRSIDAAVAFANGRCYLTWKREQRPVIAVGDGIHTREWRFLGEIAGPWCENAQFLHVDGAWRMVVQTQWLSRPLPAGTPCAAIRRMRGKGSEDEHWLLALPKSSVSAG